MHYILYYVKIIYMKSIIKLYIFIAVILFGDEPPVIMTLRNIISNDSIIFSYHQHYFNCYPYGIIALEKLLTDEKTSSTCKKIYFDFSQKYPKLHFFAHYHFHLEQNYVLDLHKEGCIIFSKGKKSYSEVLLEHGLAIINPKVKNEEYMLYFFAAQERAKRARKGLWGDPDMRKCKAELLRQ